MEPKVHSTVTRIFVAIAFATIIIGVGTLLWFSLPDAHPAAVRNKYLKGEITLEEARTEVGDVANTWVRFKDHRPD
jgi:hypothetical protein